MTLRTYVGAKLHGIPVTDKHLAYKGSVGIWAPYLEMVGIEPFEQVHIVNLSTGGRWITYALPIINEHGFTLNGGGARLGEIGDRCIVMTYVQAEAFPAAKVLHFGIDGSVTADEYA